MRVLSQSGQHSASFGAPEHVSPPNGRALPPRSTSELAVQQALPRSVMLRPRSNSTVMADVRGITVYELLGGSARLVRPIPGLRIGSPEFEHLLDIETQSVARPGNRVTLLPDGKSAYEARAKLFADAEPNEPIHQQTFVSNNDIAGWRNAAQMRAHAAKGPVRHLYDAIGSLRAIRDKRRIFSFMRNGGVQVGEIASSLGDLLTRANYRNHQKLLILGMRRAIVGGINIGDMYANGGVAGDGTEGTLDAGRGELKIVGWEKPYKFVDWRGWLGFKRRVTTVKQPWHDMDFMVEGPVIADMQRAFLRNWRQCGHKMPSFVVADMTNHEFAPFHEDGMRVRFIDHRPFEDRDDYITAAMLRHIDAAESDICIETPYFSPPKVLRDALLRATERGVRVRVLTNSREAINHKIAYDAGHGFYGELLAGGIEIYEKSSMVHGKVMIVDGQVTLGGSANMNGRTRYCDAETLIVMNDETLACATREVVEAQFAQCTRVTVEMLGGFVPSVRDFVGGLIRKSA